MPSLLPGDTGPPAEGTIDFKLPDFPNLRQTDSADRNIRYAGCGPTSWTMARRSYGDTSAQVEQTAYELRGAGAWSASAGIYTGPACTYMQGKYGLSCQMLNNTSAQIIKDNLLAGKPSLLHCRFTCYPEAKGDTWWHVTTIYGVNYTEADGKVNKFHIIDPYRNYLNAGGISLSYFLNNCYRFYTIHK